MKTILIILIVVILVALIALTLWLPSFVMTGKRQTLEEAFAWQSERYDTSMYEKLEKTDYEVTGAEDYVMHVEFLKNPEPTTKYMIITHGYTDNRMGAYKYVPMYINLGYNCVIYDIRGHGENEPTFTTYGVLEAQDLMNLIADTRQRYDDIEQLGLHGESLGAATTITSMKYKPEVDFAVADCGFSDIENVLKNAYKIYHAPTFLVDLADIGARIRYGYSIKAMHPIDSLDDNEIPILFMHGAEDWFITPKNSEDMYERTKGYKMIHKIDKAGHAESIIVNPKEYESVVAEFLTNIGM